MPSQPLQKVGVDNEFQDDGVASLPDLVVGVPVEVDQMLLGGLAGAVGLEAVDADGDLFDVGISFAAPDAQDLAEFVDLEPL